MRYFTKVILLTMKKIDIKEQKGKIKQLSCFKMWIVRNVKYDWCPRENLEEEKYGEKR